MIRLAFIDAIFLVSFALQIMNQPELYVRGIIVGLLILAIRLLGSHFSLYFWLLALPVLLLWPQEHRLTLALLLAAYYLVHYLIRYEQQRALALEDRLVKTQQMNSQYLQRIDEQAKLEEEMQYASRLEERNDLSQRIHDLVGHSLTGALLQLELAERLLDHDLAKAAELLSSSKDIIRQGTLQIRQVLREVKPEPREMGLSRLKQILDEFSKTTAMQTSLLTSGDTSKISPIQWNVLQRNLQEALTNAAKHSHASQVSCRLDVFAQRVRLEVKDNGIGSDLSTKGLGILGMEERAAKLGGFLLTDGSSGMRITTLLPFAQTPVDESESEAKTTTD